MKGKKMNIKNEKLWEEFVEKNTDDYGGCCVNVARKVMELLDIDDTPLHDGYYPDIHTPHGLITKADDEIKAGGITGFMAGCVAQMVSACHIRGEEFRTIWNGEDYKGDGVVNPAILHIKGNC
jgi:hypothetical protein